MDPRILNQVRATRTAPTDEFVDGLVRTLAEVAGGAMTVRKAKDGLSAVLKRAREGVPQLIGNMKDPVVAICLDDLAALLKAAKEPTLGEVLSASGFKPYRGGRIVIKEGRKREPLKRRGGGAANPAT